MIKYTPDWPFFWFDLGAPAWIRLLLALVVLVASVATDAHPWAFTAAEPWY